MAITYDRRLPIRSRPVQQNTSQQPAFLRLPVEIRLQIYAYLLSTPPSYTFEIRTLQPQQANFYHYKRRSKYSVPTTTGFYSSSPQILSVCRTTYVEARPPLYRNRTFSFGKDISAIVPFFEDLLPSTRMMVRSIDLTKQASWRAKDSDDAAWRYMCEYLADNAKVEKITLNVVTAKLPAIAPGSVINMPSQKYKADDFRTLMDVGYEGVDWMRDFLLLSRRWTPQDDPNGGRWYLPGWGQQEETEDGAKREGLKELVIEEEVEHCPRIDGRSPGTMTFYVTFSRSLKGFERFLRSEMLDEVDEWGRKAT